MPTTATAPAFATLTALGANTGGRVDARLTPAQVTSFVDNGFCWVSQLIKPAEIAELKADLIKLARGGYVCEQLKPARADATDQEVLDSILCIHQPHFISEIMKKYCEHPAIAGVLSQIIGAHLAHWDGAVKCMQSMLFMKGPGKPGQAWHQDEQYIPTRDRSLCGAWIALDDATISNGCLWVVPGSHRNGYFFQRRTPQDLEEYDGSDQSYGFDEARTKELGAAVQTYASSTVANPALPLRTPDAAEVYAILDAQLRRAANGQATGPEAASAAIAAWAEHDRKQDAEQLKLWRRQAAGLD